MLGLLLPPAGIWSWQGTPRGLSCYTPQSVHWCLGPRLLLRLLLQKPCGLRDRPDPPTPPAAPPGPLGLYITEGGQLRVEPSAALLGLRPPRHLLPAERSRAPAKLGRQGGLRRDGPHAGGASGDHGSARSFHVGGNLKLALRAALGQSARVRELALGMSWRKSYRYMALTTRTETLAH